ADSIQDAVGKSYAQDYIVRAQVKAGDIAGAVKTTDLIQDAETKNRFQSYIAAAQAETRSRDNPRGTVISAVVRVPAQPAIRIIQAADWLKKLDDGGKTNDCALNTGPFLDLASYLKSLPPSDDTETVFKALSVIVRKIIVAHHDIDKMLKQQ